MIKSFRLFESFNKTSKFMSEISEVMYLVLDVMTIYGDNDLDFEISARCIGSDINICTFSLDKFEFNDQGLKRYNDGSSVSIDVSIVTPVKNIDLCKKSYYDLASRISEYVDKSYVWYALYDTKSVYIAGDNPNTFKWECAESPSPSEFPKSVENNLHCVYEFRFHVKNS